MGGTCMLRQQHKHSQVLARPARGLLLPCRAASNGDGPAVPVRFTVRRKLDFGESHRVVGNHPALGNWKVRMAPRPCCVTATLRQVATETVRVALTCYVRTLQARKAPGMGWLDGDIWTIEMPLPPGTKLEFKVGPSWHLGQPGSHGSRHASVERHPLTLAAPQRLAAWHVATRPTRCHPLSCGPSACKCGARGMATPTGRAATTAA